MDIKNYLPILTHTTKKVFFDYVSSLDVPQIDYFAIGIQNILTKKSISIMSLPEWQSHFIDNNYANYDPIRKATLYTKRNIIPFREIDFLDNFGKEIMHQRKKIGIKDGIILMQRFHKFSYMITLGTGFSMFDAFEFIKKYHDRIQIIKADLIKLVEIETRAFLPREILNYSTLPSIDAR